MDFLHRLKPYHLDVLKEIGNIGAGNAATALSTLLNRTIDMSVPDVRLVSFQELPNQVGGADTEVAAIFLRIDGEAPGSMFYISSLHETEQLIRQLTHNESFQLDTPPFDELGMSALQEVGNILAGSYLSSFSDFTKLNLQPTVPGLSIDMAGAILSYGLLPLSQVGDYAIVIDTHINEIGDSATQTSGHFFLLPDPDSFDIIFSALGVEMDE
ncbi:chemotaxis protein CheC [Halalkalibacter urbisdiaboli]|uniref:chemotaxis protein CheC n=1 Tax=Halalkalibacter urbisdiaboli TaxID=1960589 RepID=UPI000B437A73|nr:chemotaxis protein CheC [Halalkalibacter urbisdiaboli]